MPQITYAFANNSEQLVNEKVLGHVLLEAVVVNKCSFQSGFCDWKNIADMDHKWKLSTDLYTLMNYTGYFAYIDGVYKAQLKSPLLPWKPFHRTVGLCLRFKYLMKTHSKSYLRIFLKEAKQEKPVLAWQLSGYHGEDWSLAQVVWSGADTTQIIFEGEGFLPQKLHIAIDNITVTTENCSLRPYFAKPDFKCSDNQFRCTNGECVKKNLLCDGDYACKDRSDEENCACPTNMFQCKGGGCLQATALCDDTKQDGCDGEDEINCRNPCSDYQCLDGSCIPWESTCSKTSFCRDKTNTPSICGSGKCHLNDLACSSKTSIENKLCRSFRGHCNFQNGLCGLRTDKNDAIQWTVGSGQTPTESTGPSHDHTSFNKKGSYIYIEASQRKPGERARLLSSWMEPNETICLQFWYHMHGSNIGNLSVYLKTNQSESLVWRLSGENGNRWRFGQTALNSPNYYKFVLEGTVGGGSKGDIAMDDLMVLDGNCETILKQGSPDCHFEESMCEWEAQEGWVLDPILVGLEKWGGYISLAGVTATLSSPIINTHDYEWKCFRFRYFIGSIHFHHFDIHFLKVIIRSVTSNQTMQLFFDDKVTNELHYVQIPIPSNYSNAQIDFFAGKDSLLSFDLVIAIDGVSFSKEPCERIPWKPENDHSCGNFDFEKGTLEGWIAHGAAFSHQPTLGDNIRARTSGYNKTSSGHQGSWWIGTYENRSKADIPAGEVQGNTPTGGLVSSLISITGPDANFLLGGGCGSKTVVYLMLDGIPRQFNDKIKCKEQMVRVTSRVFKDFIGRVGRIVLLDYDEGGHLNFDDFRGDFVCLDEPPCDITKNWCGWRSLRGWKRISHRDLEQQGSQESRADDNADSTNERVIEVIDLDNYEIHLPDESLGYVSLSDIPPLYVGLTSCFWLNTVHSGFVIEYKVVSEQNESTVLGFYYDKSTFRIHFYKIIREIELDVADGSWHHLCVTWERKNRLLSVYKNGQRKYLSNEYKAGARNRGIEGGGTMTIGFRSPYQNISAVLGKLSGFNLWSYQIKAEEILRMSQGCGNEAGDVKAWETVSKGLTKEVEVKWHRSCRDRKADRIVLDTNTTLLNQTAILVSQKYNRSRDWHTKCLKFRYMLRGPGRKSLTIYQQTGNYREVPIWIWKTRTGNNWVYGQVPLSAVSASQVFIKGKVEKKEAFVALSGLYVEEDPSIHCQHLPQLAKQACSETLFNTSGNFFSPFFPGFYFDDSYCTWHITVPEQNIIRLTFQEFRLNDHPTCEDCFVEIFDGSDDTAPSIGRFCGYSYPPILSSSSNHFSVVLRCQGKPFIARFKASYFSVAAYDDNGLSCLRQQGCPSSCKCDEFGKGQSTGKRIMVTGEDLLTVPTDLPSNTGAVFFQRNRISQLREKDFTNLHHLEYIDLSYNILLRLDGDSFQNVTSIKTLRLNSNFLRSLPAKGFARIPSIRVLDLGRNLLRKTMKETFYGLSSLEILSLRSNQIEKMEYGVFTNKSNLTHLYLQENKITTLPDGLFESLSKLKFLDLSNNQLTTVSRKTFRGLISLEYLYLDKNKLTEVSPEAFSELRNMKYLKLDRFILCCYAKKSISGVDCDSPVDEFSSCDDLMKNNTLQICIWILGILAFVGNLLVIIWRAIDKEENRTHSFLLTNLAFADLFMGVYLLTIAVMDLRWRGEYFKHDVKWRSGLGCQITGALSMLSSEVSVLILTIITLDRLVCIVFPFKFKRLTYKAAVLICIGVWVFGFVISLIPISGINYFIDENGNFGFYSRSAVCLPLQLSAARPAGWEYSVVFFVGLNSISFIFILIAYISMFWTVKRVSRAVRSSNLKKESAMAKRLVFIIMTDFCCWMPIIIINILSLTGNFYDPNKIAYVWIAVFVLPLNSSLNPILYTFSTKRAKRSLNRRRKNVTNLVLKSVQNRRLQGRKQTTDWLKTYDDLTLVSNVVTGSSPLSLTRATEISERNCKQVHAKLRLIEEVDILQDDTAGKSSTGFALAWCEEESTLSMVLLKYFAKESKEDWSREVDIAKSLSFCDQPHASLLRYRWHSKARDQSIEHGKKKINALCPRSLLICYEFVSSSTLEDFLCDKGTVLNFDGVCTVATDVISAIERLEDLGILHNNISTRNILIGPCTRLPPIRAVLGGFSQVSKANEPGAYTNWTVEEHGSHGNDLEQFGQLLATLLGHCHGSSEYTQLHEIMNLCFQENLDGTIRASYIRELLEEAWLNFGVWDTAL
ncbi:hypothetical protein ABFA07_010120 [Porites harrisoni]